ncbi:hypothetical protein J3459_014740 [Metarhizium acridum]|nr:hypothetical protein J3459_014740 [Metarhizium acridum]
MTPPLHRGFGHWPRSKLSPRPVRDCACGLLLGCWKQTCGGLFLDSEDLGSRSEASESRTLQSYYIEHTKTVRSVAFGKARKLLATGADDKVKDVSSIWDVEKEANGDIHATTSDYSGVESGTKDTSEVAAIGENTESGEGKPADDTDNWSNDRSDSDRINCSQSHLGIETTKLREPLRILSGHKGANFTLSCSRPIRSISPRVQMTAQSESGSWTSRSSETK